MEAMDVTDYQTMEDFTEKLPEEVVLNIFGNLEPKDLANTARVNSEWKRFSHDNGIWRKKSQQTYSRVLSTFLASSYEPPSSINYKQFYKWRMKTDTNWRSGQTRENIVLEGHSEVVFCVKIIDKDHVLSASADGTIRIWNIATQDTIHILSDHEGGILGLDYDKKRKRVASGSFQGKMIVHDIDLSKRGQLKSMKVKELKELLASKNIPYSDCLEKSDLVRRCEAYGISPFGRITHSFDTGQNVIVGINMKDDILASSGNDSKIKIWSLAEEKSNPHEHNDIKPIHILTGHTESVACVDLYDNCTKLFSGSNDTTVKLWDIKTGQVLRNFVGHTGWVWGARYNDYANNLITSSVDHTIRLWDVNSGKQIGLFRGHQQAISGISATFEEHRLVSASFDGSVRIWDLRYYVDGKSLAVLTGHRERCARVDNDDNMILSSSFDCTARIWKMTPYEFNA